DRTVASAYSVRPLPDARVSMPLAWDEVADVEPADFTLATVPALFAQRDDAHAGIDDAVGSLDALLELSERHEREGLGDAPWPPNYRKQATEPPRVQPSRQRRPDAEYDTPAAEARREKSRAAMERRLARAAEERAALRASGGSSRPTPTGRRRSTKPVVEIARAAKKEEALAGLERWQQRHPEVVPHLQPADVLVDSMRGRSTTWTRIRVNLEHVPEELRPAQEPLEVDYDPWAGYEWPDRSGQLERARRRRQAE
ncbi:MAG TPA: hypothetical protein VH741_01210, partial [Candidatus Limnocylindrales bacterium]